jgi:hypothetical protein
MTEAGGKDFYGHRNCALHMSTPHAAGKSIDIYLPERVCLFQGFSRKALRLHKLGYTSEFRARFRLRGRASENGYR